MIDEFNVIYESQAGLRQKYSTTDNRFTLNALVQKILCREGGRFYCLFIDFKKKRSIVLNMISCGMLWKEMKLWEIFLK